MSREDSYAKMHARMLLDEPKVLYYLDGPYLREKKGLYSFIPVRKIKGEYYSYKPGEKTGKMSYKRKIKDFDKARLFQGILPNGLRVSIFSNVIYKGSTTLMRFKGKIIGYADGKYKIKFDALVKDGNTLFDEAIENYDIVFLYLTLEEYKFKINKDVILKKDKSDLKFLEASDNMDLLVADKTDLKKKLTYLEAYDNMKTLADAAEADSNLRFLADVAENAADLSKLRFLNIPITVGGDTVMYQGHVGTNLFFENDKGQLWKYGIDQFKKFKNVKIEEISKLSDTYKYREGTTFKELYYIGKRNSYGDDYDVFAYIHDNKLYLFKTPVDDLAMRLSALNLSDPKQVNPRSSKFMSANGKKRAFKTKENGGSKRAKISEPVEIIEISDSSDSEDDKGKKEALGTKKNGGSKRAKTSEPVEIIEILDSSDSEDDKGKKEALGTKENRGSKRAKTSEPVEIIEISKSDPDSDSYFEGFNEEDKKEIDDNSVPGEEPYGLSSSIVDKSGKTIGRRWKTRQYDFVGDFIEIHMFEKFDDDGTKIGDEEIIYREDGTKLATTFRTTVDDYDIEETIDNPKVTDVIEISDSRESKEAEIQKIVDDIFGDVTTSNNDTVKEIKSTNMSDSDSHSIVSMSARNRNKAFIKKFIYPTQFLETGYDVEIGDLVTVKIADEKDTLTGTLVRVTKTDVDVQIYTEKGSVLHRIGYDGSEPRLKSLELVKDPKKFTGFEVGSVVAIKHVDFETYLYSVLRYVTDTVIFANVVRYFKEGDNIFTKTKLERFKRSDIIGIELLKQTIYPKSFVKLLGTTYGFKLQDTISQKLRELFKDDIEFQPGSPIDIYLKDIILHVNIVSNDGISITCKCYGEKTKIKIPYYLIEKIMEY